MFLLLVRQRNEVRIVLLSLVCLSIGIQFVSSFKELTRTWPWKINRRSGIAYA
jgi:hypothetical protein